MRVHPAACVCRRGLARERARESTLPANVSTSTDASHRSPVSDTPPLRTASRSGPCPRQALMPPSNMRCPPTTPIGRRFPLPSLPHISCDIRLGQPNSLATSHIQPNTSSAGPYGNGPPWRLLSQREAAVVHGGRNSHRFSAPTVACRAAGLSAMGLVSSENAMPVTPVEQMAAAAAAEPVAKSRRSPTRTLARWVGSGARVVVDVRRSPWDRVAGVDLPGCGPSLAAVFLVHLRRASRRSRRSPRPHTMHLVGYFHTRPRAAELTRLTEPADPRHPQCIGQRPISPPLHSRFNCRLNRGRSS